MKLSAFIITLFIGVSLAPVVRAQTDTATAAVLHSPIKTLTDEQYAAMMRSDEVGNMSAPATMNNYPHPEHVLKFAKELKLTAEQMKQFNEIMRVLNMKRKEVAASMIMNEKTLNAFFSNMKANEGNILFYGTRYGSYMGELRVALLMACFQTRKVLTAWQMNKFYTLEKP